MAEAAAELQVIDDPAPGPVLEPAGEPQLPQELEILRDPEKCCQ